MKILRENTLVLFGREKKILGVLKQREKNNWWVVGVVHSEHPSYPPGGYDLALHADDMEALEVEPSDSIPTLYAVSKL